jgi:hypothetical protein
VTKPNILLFKKRRRRISQQAGIEGMGLNTIKVTCDKPTANVILNSEKLGAFPLRSGIRQE